MSWAIGTWLKTAIQAAITAARDSINSNTTARLGDGATAAQTGTTAATTVQGRLRELTFNRIGAVNATGGTATAGPANAKLNAIITALGGNLGGSRMQIFTANGTWTRPPGVNSVTAICIAGGGGGGRPALNISGLSPGWTAGGGGAGGLAIRTVPVTGNITVTIGAGGNGATTASGTGSAGGVSSFGNLVSASGGRGGTATTNNANQGGAAGAHHGFTLHGSTNLDGGNNGQGGAGRLTGQLAGANPGALGAFNGNGAAGANAGANTSGGGGGGGGGGTGGVNTNGGNGGNGGSGLVVVIW